jgi:hypothetical protein
MTSNNKVVTYQHLLEAIERKQKNSFSSQSWTHAKKCAENKKKTPPPSTPSSLQTFLILPKEKTTVWVK